MEALKLLNSGKLVDAISSASEYIRDNPSAVPAREILVELYCLSGQWERADKQLETILSQSPSSLLNVSLLRQLIRGQLARMEVWTQGRVPEFIGKPNQLLQQTLRAWLYYRQGHGSESLEAVESVAETIPSISGNCDGWEFTGMIDLDDLCVGIFEVLTSTGKYFWIPMGDVKSISFAPVKRPRDLLWRQCEMSVRNGPDGVVYIPTLYISTDQTTDSTERLGRATSWTQVEASPVLGSGQRTFLMGDREIGIMEIESIDFVESTEGVVKE